jgi:hypothetical protein
MSVLADVEDGNIVTKEDLSAAVAKLEGELNAALKKIGELTSAVLLLNEQINAIKAGEA